jgi:hypothetical protein
MYCLQAQVLDVGFRATDEASCLALKDLLVCEAVNDLEKAVEVDKLQCESDSLNKQVCFSFHSYCHSLIGLVLHAYHCT